MSQIHLDFPAQRAFHYAPPQVPLDILHADSHIIIISKPSGLLSVPGKSDDHKDCLETRLRERFPKILTVHRLDLATSGLMVFARTPHAQRHLGLQFEKRYVKKSYIADVWGQPCCDSGHINLPIATDWPNRPRQTIDFEKGRSAQTDWVCEKHERTSSRMQLYPRTGRSHQLRLHMMVLGTPILGDALYAHDEAYEAADRLALHAASLSFHHPGNGERISFTKTCPF